MRTICITIRGTPRAQVHFAERGLAPQIFHGIDAAKLGIQPMFPFDDERPGPVAERVGCWLSHRLVWSACLLLPDDEFFILEDDARFTLDWRARLETARQHLPADWDVLFAGSGWTAKKRARRVSGQLYEFEFVGKYPLCPHAVVVRRKALPVLIETMDYAGIRIPIDIALGLYAFPKLKVFGILPRIADQWGVHLAE